MRYSSTVYKESANKIREMLQNKTVASDCIELMTRAALALDTMDALNEIVSTPGVKDQFIGRRTRDWIRTANNVGDYYKEIRG